MAELFTGRRNHGSGHSYFADCDCVRPGAAGCSHRLTGVTTILGALPKRALIRWAAGTAADEAIDHWDELGQLPPMERHERLVTAHLRVNTEAKVKGTRVHALADRLSRGEVVAVPEEIEGYVHSAVQFLDDFEVVTVLTETAVISRRYRYGGTLDWVGDLLGERWLLDWKSSRKGPYGETAFQLAAYRYADTWLTPDGRLDVDRCGVVWLRSDGYDLIPYEADEYVHRQFLYIQQTHQADKDSADYKGDPIPPPVRAA